MAESFNRFEDLLAITFYFKALLNIFPKFNNLYYFEETLVEFLDRRANFYGDGIWRKLFCVVGDYL